MAAQTKGGLHEHQGQAGGWRRHCSRRGGAQRSVSAGQHAGPELRGRQRRLVDAGFQGIAVTGSANLADNIWISNGSDEAVTPGTYSLGSPVDFSYGFDNHNGTFWMASGPYAGQTLTAAQIAADFPDSEAYALVGVVYT